MAAAIPHARLVELRGAGHCPMLEQPEAVNAALLDLAAAVEAGSSVPARTTTRPGRTTRSRRTKEKVAS
jgi:hypothetical protein